MVDSLDNAENAKRNFFLTILYQNQFPFHDKKNYAFTATKGCHSAHEECDRAYYISAFEHGMWPLEKGLVRREIDIWFLKGDFAGTWPT